MDELINLTRAAVTANTKLPFIICSSLTEQSFKYFPVKKPALIFMLNGEKKLSGSINLNCKKGEFVFLAENFELTVSNVPIQTDYIALYIEFEYSDFENIEIRSIYDGTYLVGEIDTVMVQFMTQFFEWSQVSPTEIWHLRRVELLQLLCHLGYQDVISMVSKKSILKQILDVFKQDPSIRLTMLEMCEKLALTESTLRRRLKSEGTTFRELNTQVRLAYGLHLLKTTDYSISHISEKCGYLSQSRFTERFREMFSLTPLKIRQSTSEAVVN